MAINQVQRIALGTLDLSGGSASFSNWKTYFTSIGFVEVEEHPELLRWKDSDFGIQVIYNGSGGAASYVHTYNFKHNATQAVGRISSAGIAGTIQYLTYRLINDKSIMFTVNAVSDGKMTPTACFIQPTEGTNEDWMFIGGNAIGAYVGGVYVDVTTPVSTNYTLDSVQIGYSQGAGAFYPADLIQLGKFYYQQSFRENICVAYVHPMLGGIGTLFVASAGNKKYLLIPNSYEVNQRVCFAIDITSEYEE